MRAILHGLPLLLLAACGVDETVFIPEYTELYCAKVQECLGEPTKVFDGLGNKDQCLGTVGPEVEDMIGYCDYNPKAAKKCLSAMANMGCPGAGQSVDDVLPLDCSEALNACNPPADEEEDTSPDPTGTEPTTTGGTGA